MFTPKLQIKDDLDKNFKPLVCSLLVKHYANSIILALRYILVNFLVLDFYRGLDQL